MNRGSAFARRHPTALLLWFIPALCVTVLSYDPVYALISLAAAALYNFVQGGADLRGCARWLVFIACVTAINPLFSHHGVTVLFFLGGLPVTLEAVLFGAFMACAAASALMWCRVLTRCMTSDKIIWLFGKPFPRLAVMISLSLRLVPRIRDEHRRLCEIQRALGLFSGNLFSRVSAHMKVISALITSVLEGSIDTSDSMRARGIALKGRTVYSDFIFGPADGAVAAASLLCSLCAFFSYKYNVTGFSFYPVIIMPQGGAFSAAAYTLFGVFMMIPAASEVIFWKRLSSNA